MSEFSKSITVMSEYVQNVFGQFDVHAKKIEKAFHVSMILRDDKLKVSGEEKDVEQAVHVLIQLFAVAARGTAISASYKLQICCVVNGTSSNSFSIAGT